MSRKSPILALPIRRALKKLGTDLRDARRRRRLPADLVAERAGIARTTLWKVERGTPTVSLGTYAAVMFVLGLGDRLTDLADVRTDPVGLALDEERLPTRVRLPRATPPAKTEG